MEEESHIGDNDVIDVGKQLIGWMISKLTRPKRVEAAYATEQSALLSQLFVDKTRQWSQGNKPGPLNIVHLLE
jgi:hypothetical protein